MGWINQRLQTQTTDTIEMVWSADPAVVAGQGEKPGLIPLAEATTQGKPDVFVLRPLNSAEYIRICDLVSRGVPAMATIEAAYTATAEIRVGNGAVISDASKIREILANHCPADLLAEIGQWVVKSSRKGVDDLPFRVGGAQASGGDPVVPIRADLQGLSARTAL